MIKIDADLNQRVDYEIMMLEHAREKYALRLEHLAGYKGAFLRWAKHGKNKYYYIKRTGSALYKYVGRSNQQDVQRVREARFLEEAIRRIDRNIELLKTVSDGFSPFDQSSVNDSLPEVYRCAAPPVSELYEREGKKWLSKRLEFQKRFPENYPEKKRQPTSDGIMVKSLSEVVLYEKFKDAGLAQIYELPFLPSDHGPALYPDFTILSPIDMKTEIIVEYVGRMDLLDYRGDFAKRVGRYLDSGYTPGVNLFFVFSNNDGSIDSMQITKVISDILGIRN